MSVRLRPRSRTKPPAGQWRMQRIKPPTGLVYYEMSKHFDANAFQNHGRCITANSRESGLFKCALLTNCGKIFAAAAVAQSAERVTRNN
jgi:hypothetical protein